MSKTRPCTRRASRRQRGSALLDSLIGMLILSISLLGSMLTLSSSVRTQHVNGVRAQVIGQLRDQLLQQGASLCDATVQLTVNNRPMETQVECPDEASTVAVSLPAADNFTYPVNLVDSPIITVRVNAELLGGVLTVSSWRQPQ